MNEEQRQKDAEEIGKTLKLQMKGFQTRDVSAWESIYTEDADWTNAFGISRTGPEEIMDYVDGLFEQEGDLGPRNFVQEPQFDIRMLSDEVCVVRTYTEIEDQKVSQDETINRRTFSQKVLTRQDDGRWLIASELFMDANQVGSYRDDLEIGLNKTRM